jgi:hypothetical protein
MDESTHAVGDGLKVTHAETAAAATTETRGKTSLAEGVLIDLVAPAEAASSVLPVPSSENVHRNSIMDEPIDVAEGESQYAERSRSHVMYLARCTQRSIYWRNSYVITFLQIKLVNFCILPPAVCNRQTVYDCMKLT